MALVEDFAAFQAGALVDAGQRPMIMRLERNHPGIPGAYHFGAEPSKHDNGERHEVASSFRHVALSFVPPLIPQSDTEVPSRRQAYTQVVQQWPSLDPYLPPNWRNNLFLLCDTIPYTCTGDEMGDRQSSGTPLGTSTHLEGVRQALGRSRTHAPTATMQYRARVQQGFYQNALLTVGSDEWKRALARGRCELRLTQEVIRIRKFRSLQKRYDWSSQLSYEELLAAAKGDSTWVQQQQLGLTNKDVYGYTQSKNNNDGH